MITSETDPYEQTEINHSQRWKRVAALFGLTTGTQTTFFMTSLIHSSQLLAYATLTTIHTSLFIVLLEI